MIKKLLVCALGAASLSGSMAQTTLANGLKAYYPFNGNALDESGNGYNGTVTAATLATDRFGKANSAYSFNGTSAYITTSLNAIPTKKISICAWVKTPGDAKKAFMGIVFARAGYDMATGLGWDQNAAVYFCLNSGTPSLAAAGAAPYAALLNNGWHFMVGTYDGAKNKIYMDGVLVKETTMTVDYVLNANFKIGHDDIQGYQRHFNGLIDDVRIYDRAITADEVAALNIESSCVANETDILVIKTVITGTDNTAYQNSIKVYPNPASNQLTIDYGNHTLLSGYKVNVVNSSGVTVFENTISQAISEIDLNTWTGAGLYYIRIYDNKGNTLQVRKIVLQ